MTETVEQYRERMTKCPQFAMFDVEPLFVPGTKDIAGFIHDEVVRQYHDPNVRTDGGARIEAMTQAWEYAKGNYHIRRYPTLEDVLIIAKLVEPPMNTSGWRKVGVRVGPHIAPSPDQVPLLMDELWENGLSSTKLTAMRGGRFDADEAKPIAALVREKPDEIDAFYVAFETVHPFGDGNGRTGKIIHNWLLGTLDDPVLVQDFFGGGNP